MDLILASVFGWLVLAQINITQATVDAQSDNITAALSPLLSILGGLVVGAVIISIAANFLLRFKNS